MPDQTTDVLVLGGGHNGLVAACYLAKAGLRTLVLEAKDHLGGGCSTEELTAPGFRHDPCAGIHGGIVTGPVLRDLELERFGLRYVFPDPTSASVFPDGVAITAWRDVERTAQGLERFSKADADGYRYLLDIWEHGIRRWYVPTRYAPPMKLSEAYANLEASPRGAEVMRLMASSPLEIAHEFFRADHVQAHVIKAAIQGGLMPDQFGYGIALFAALGGRHSYGWAFPEGGSIELPNALERCLEHHGGGALTNARAREVLVEGGRATGVITDDGRQFRAEKALLAGVHVRQLFLEMLDSRWVDAELARSLASLRYGLSEVVLHVAMTEAPRFRPEFGVDSVVHVQAPESVADLVAANAEYRKKNLYPRAPFQILTHTYLDPSRAPSGGHVLNVGHYTPYDLHHHPQEWDEIKPKLLEDEMA
ncbi:MAG TPA: NAD(P)/FAD-dependent oxidoreductase, partial [Chloroflexota bacterium]|nr:NAD(P)/FAD-dependent oxidoreductase [Chloroflexota bacterium]